MPGWRATAGPMARAYCCRLDRSILSFQTGRKICGVAMKNTRCAGFACIRTITDTNCRTQLFAEVLKLAASRGIIVQLALCMEDERTQHPLMRVAPVDLTPFADLAQAEPKLKLVVLNCYPQLIPAQITPLIPIRNVYFELSMVERVGAVARLIETFTLERVLFGSHSPFFYFESAELKVQEAGLSDAQKKRVLEGNAKRLFS